MPEFLDTHALAAALAGDVAAALRREIAACGRASLAVSGGTTPKKFFSALSRERLAWEKVTVTLVDDRLVGEESERSNVRLVREFLLRDAAAAARFVPLGEAAALRELLPLSVAILGMGADGHTASLFPGGDHLAAALTGPHLIERMTAPGAAEPRVTMTLPVLLGAKFLALHIEGAAKQAALRAAREPGPVEDMPIRAVLARQPGPLIYWCP